MAVAYSLQQESLDELVWRTLGSTDSLEQILAANPGLGGKGPHLPERTPVILPDTLHSAPALRPRETENLWD